MKLSHTTFAAALLTAGLNVATPAEASERHGEGRPSSEPTTVYQGGGGAEVEVGNENTFSPEVANELNNWIKNSQSQYNGGNEVGVDISGLSPEARAEVQNWVEARGGSVEQEFGDGSFSPNSMSSLEADLRNSVTATSDSVSSSTNTIDASDRSVTNTEIDARGGAITGAPSMGSLFVPDRCMNGFQFSIGGGTPFGGSGGIGFTKIDPAGVAFQDGTSVQAFLEMDRETRSEYTSGFDEGDLEKLNCLTTVAQSQIDLFSHQLTMKAQQNDHLERMQDARFEQEALMKQLEVAGEAYLRHVEHVCGHTEWRPSIAEHRKQCDRVYEDTHTLFTFKPDETPFKLSTAKVAPAAVRAEEDVLAPAAPEPGEQ